MKRSRSRPRRRYLVNEMGGTFICAIEEIGQQTAGRQEVPAAVIRLVLHQQKMIHLYMIIN